MIRIDESQFVVVPTIERRSFFDHANFAVKSKGFAKINFVALGNDFDAGKVDAVQCLKFGCSENFVD